MGDRGNKAKLSDAEKARLNAKIEWAMWANVLGVLAGLCPCPASPPLTDRLIVWLSDDTDLALRDQCLP